MNGKMILLPLPSRNDVREMATKSHRLEFVGGIAFGQIREGFDRGSGRDGEIALDFAAEGVEIGFEDFWFLGRRERTQAVFLASASLLQRDFSGGFGVANPLCPAARSDQEALATESEEVNGR
jgi:hypothetical protein